MHKAAVIKAIMKVHTHTMLLNQKNKTHKIYEVTEFANAVQMKLTFWLPIM